MARVKGSVTSSKRRRNILAAAKGFRFNRSTKKRSAKEALLKARSYAFRDRKKKKTTMRQLAIVKVNAAVRTAGFKNYSTFIAALKKHHIDLNRKILAELAAKDPRIIATLVKKIS